MTIEEFGIPAGAGRWRERRGTGGEAARGRGRIVRRAELNARGIVPQPEHQDANDTKGNRAD